VHELVPIVLGALVGIATLAIHRPGLRLWVRVAVAIVIGVAWSTTIGEDGPLFAAWDTIQALGAALLCATIVGRVRGRRAA
jgi:hypothetical protein